MITRLFPSDENSILMEAQALQKDTLLKYLVDFVKQYYQLHYNPLGLIDDIIIEINKEKDYPMEAFEDFYHDLSAVYRFRNGEVQLEILFDGSTHFEKYSNDWTTFFKQNVYAFCANKYFLRAVLDISVFHHYDRVAFLAGDRLKYFLTNYFDLKVYKYRGIMEVAS